MILCAQTIRMRCAHKSDAAAVCAKLKAMSKRTAICDISGSHGDEYEDDCLLGCGTV
jgi:hypothetical protein